MDFKEFPKIPRINRTVICCEKIDGTNACIVIADEGDRAGVSEAEVGANRIARIESKGTMYDLYVQSRNRMITPKSDNYGFARWVELKAQELVDGLGAGYHFGEWWGQGIQRDYGMPEKRFSLFNVGRWNNNNPPPACCHTVPVVLVHEGFSAVDAALEKLRAEGSMAAPGFMDPEGIVAFHRPSGYMFKATLIGDEEPKSKWMNKKKNDKEFSDEPQIEDIGLAIPA